MDEPAYPLAQSDRSFAFDGAYRTPHSLSAATRAAYGMHDLPCNEEPQPFSRALQQATVDPIRNGPNVAAHHLAHVAISHQRFVASEVRAGVSPRDADLAARAIRTTASPRPSDGRPVSFYYLFASSVGCIVRAIVWRGRVFSGGTCTCPKSKP